MQNISIYFKFIQRFKAHFFLLVFLFLLVAIFEALSIGSLYPIFSSLMTGGSTDSDPGKIVNAIFDIVNWLPFEDKVVAACALAIFFNLTNNLIGFIADSIAAYCKYSLYEKYLNMGFENIFSKEYSFIKGKSQGELVYIGETAMNAVGELFHYLPKTIVEVFKCAAITLLLATISIKSTLFVLFAVGGLAFVYYFISVRYSYPLNLKVQNAQKSQMSIFIEAITGVKTLIVYNALKFFKLNYFRETKSMKEAFVKSHLVGFIPSRLGTVGSICGAIIAIIYARIYHPGSFVAYFAIITTYFVALQKMIPTVANIGNNWIGLKSIKPRLEDVKSFLEDQNLELASKGIKFQENIDFVNFEDVSFSYSDEPNKKVLDKISFKIPSKKTVALVGSSGAGKSTIVNLLTRVYEPTSGKIKVNDTYLDTISLESWRSRISTVDQTPVVFNLSVKDNIVLGNESISKEILERSLEVVQAEALVKSLPDGLDTMLGDQGNRLSGGQKQKISIARALAHEPDLLILDEATSALDNISEREFQDRLEALSNKYTIVIIAHRLSTIKQADEIIVLDEGRIVESGSHDDLVLKNGFYSDLLKSTERDSHQNERA